jgi:hypothetical protein
MEACALLQHRCRDAQARGNGGVDCLPDCVLYNSANAGNQGFRMANMVRRFFGLMPLWFGIGFIAPLTAQIIMTSGLEASFPVAPIVVGLVVGIVWGGTTVVRGRWI